MTARSITARERELLGDRALDRLERLLDVETEPDPIGDEWPHDHPPGAAEPIDGALEVELADNSLSWDRTELTRGGRSP